MVRPGTERQRQVSHRDRPDASEHAGGAPGMAALTRIPGRAKRPRQPRAAAPAAAAGGSGRCR